MTTERSLIPALARQMGDTDASNYSYTTNQLFSAINDGYAELNRRGYKQQFAVTGSGDAATFTPTPTGEEERLIVLCAAFVLNIGEVAKGARNAVIHSNVAGRTDLTVVPLALSSLSKALDKQITNSIDMLNQRTGTISTEGQTLVEGEELKSSDNGTEDNYAEGLVRTTISTGR